MMSMISLLLTFSAFSASTSDWSLVVDVLDRGVHHDERSADWPAAGLNGQVLVRDRDVAHFDLFTDDDDSIALIDDHARVVARCEYPCLQHFVHELHLIPGIGGGDLYFDVQLVERLGDGDAGEPVVGGVEAGAGERAESLGAIEGFFDIEGGVESCVALVQYQGHASVLDERVRNVHFQPAAAVHFAAGRCPPGAVTMGP